MWESRDKKEPRSKYFNLCLERLDAITERAPSFDGRQVTKTLRKTVWRKCETDYDNKCAVCECEEITEDTFEVGHIVARVLGGTIEISNLIPICFGCNRNMGIRNACEYKEDAYPHSTKTLV
jgi:5-methylcytosine-specific restriction endonuclease McrA